MTRGTWREARTQTRADMQAYRCDRGRGLVPRDACQASRFTFPDRALVPEQGQHGEYAAVVVLGVAQVELLKDRLDVPLDGP